MYFNELGVQVVHSVTRQTPQLNTPGAACNENTEGTLSLPVRTVANRESHQHNRDRVFKSVVNIVEDGPTAVWFVHLSFQR
jgi:hypothetical protein